MGTFDSVDVEHYCPKCNEKQADYQTKDLGRQMQHYKVGEPFILFGMKVQEGEFAIYDICLKCHKEVQGKAYVGDGKLRKVSEFSKVLEKVIVEYHQNQ